MRKYRYSTLNWRFANCRQHYNDQASPAIVAASVSFNSTLALQALAKTKIEIITVLEYGVVK
jgi:hypothetical protein